MAKIGYMRVSTADGRQTTDPQEDALAYCRSNSIDTLVVWRLRKLSRSLKKLIEVINDLDNRDIAFQRLTDSCQRGRWTFRWSKYLSRALSLGPMPRSSYNVQYSLLIFLSRTIRL